MATLADGNIILQEFAIDADRSYLLEFGNQYVNVWYGGTKKATITTPFAGTELRKLRFAQSADVMFIASGTHPVQVLTRKSDTSWTLTEFVPEPGYFDATTMQDGVTITPSATSGSVTLTASASVFSSAQVGNWVQLKQDVASATVTAEATISKADGQAAPDTVQTVTTAAILAGEKGWKVISHGTWTGSFSIEYSADGSTWKELRSYTSNGDYNPTESGTFDKLTYIRAKVNLKVRQDSNGDYQESKITVDLTRMPFTNKGTARITAVASGTSATAKVEEKFAGTGASEDWAFGEWSAAYGYPSCVTFFQDRLCFAANNRYPYMLWMSRTGDYYNFGTEEAAGELTDDSAVALSFISRRDFRIKHLLAQSDLIILTEGNEWIISGSSTITPKNVTPQVQTSRGTTDVQPVLVGGQMIYVQRHGKSVRDLDYNYVTEKYDGADLTILAKHLTQDTEVRDAAYKQEPDYMIFFVLENGTIACLTYINDQKVFAWGRMETDGEFVAVETLSTPDEDDVYFVVRRNGENYLERLSDYAGADDPDAYIMLDCAVAGSFEEMGDVVTATHLAGRKVDVLADGQHLARLVVGDAGAVELPVKCSHYVVGLPYESVMELPNIELQLQDGTLQGRYKKVSEVILRLTQSLGGKVGINTDKVDGIKYEELKQQPPTLFSGEKRVTVPNVNAGGFNDQGRVVIVSSHPYPLSVASLVRVLTVGG